jgi:shikimate kinase
MKVYLIGMPGSGKSTLGKQLALELGLPFVDLDEEIEKREGKSIPDIFREKGEDQFRQVESQLLHEWAASVDGFIMATGGGAPCFYQGIDVINNSGISIYLRVPVAELLRRTENQDNRPLLSARDREEKEKRLNQLLEAREKIYAQAKVRIPDPTIAQLKAALKIKK